MLSKSVTKRTAEIRWGEDDEVVAEVHALSPDDIAQLVVELSEDIGGAFEAWDKIDSLDFTSAKADPSAFADALLGVLPTAMAQLRLHMPDVLARLIARAAREPEAWEYVRDNYDANLQFLILAEVARITFTSVAGFKAFVGNVVALVGTLQSLTSAKKPKALASQPSSDGFPE